MGWISVKDDLPSCNRRRNSFGSPVIVYQPANKERTVFEAFYGKRVTDRPTFYLHGCVLDGVVAWQPMPDHPTTLASPQRGGAD